MQAELQLTITPLASSMYTFLSKLFELAITAGPTPHPTLLPTNSPTKSPTVSPTISPTPGRSCDYLPWGMYWHERPSGVNR